MDIKWDKSLKMEYWNEKFDQKNKKERWNEVAGKKLVGTWTAKIKFETKKCGYSEAWKAACLYRHKWLLFLFMAYAF